MDLDKYRNLFLEEATECLADLSRALLALEKDPALGEQIESVFRAAHSIKSMAASLGFESIRDLAHRLEDRMEQPRRAGRVDGERELPLLFRGLEGLETLVAAVRGSSEPPAADPSLLAALSTSGPAPGDAGDAGGLRGIAPGDAARASERPEPGEAPEKKASSRA